ncbi:MAG: ABC transporter ATP-binding protein [Lachnospiraceae bacterium]|nr:ABC transporter ATP-binding protein [Lachnospiraceae bacterium]
MADNSLILNNVSFSFKDKTILENVNYEFEKGKLYMLIARNGTGKSTLFKLISNEYRDYSGIIKGNNSVIVHEQQPIYFEDMTVRENIETFIYCLNAKKEVDVVLTDYELKNIEKKVSKKLSGGEKQRLYLAITSLNNEEVYLFDEGDSALDPIGRTFYYTIIKKRARNNKIVIAISHHLTESIHYADEICFLSNNVLKKIKVKELPENFMELNEDKMMEYLERRV